MHVKGFTKQHPDVPEPLRGTYAGLASEPVIKYLKDLNITAVELLPVHHFLNDRTLIEKGLTNYWGYNTLGFFAPQLNYYSPNNTFGAVYEFKMMVRSLHAAGIEVILDVVYNHTAEGNQMGPTLSCAASTTRATTVSPRRTRATTWTSPAAATRSTCSIPRSSSLSWTACVTG